MEVIEAVQYSPVSSAELIQWQTQLINQMSTINLEYIGIALTIVLASGGLLYFFTVKPFERELQRQAKDIDESMSSLQELVNTSVREMESKMSTLTDDINADTEKRVSESSANVLERVRELIKAEVASLRTELFEELRKLGGVISEIKIAAADTANATKNTDVQIKSLQERVNDINLDVKWLESFRYRRENKMGMISVPLDAIETVLGTANEWRIGTLFLNELVDAVGEDGSWLDSKNKEEIRRVLSRLEKNEYLERKSKILAALNKDQSSKV